MSRRTAGSLLLSGAFTLLFGIAPLTAQTTQSTATNTSTSAPVTSTVKKAKSSAATAATAVSSTAAAPQKGMVWVNTASGAYHREGTKYYGKTKQGKYMTEADAQKAGYHLAKNEAKP